MILYIFLILTISACSTGTPVEVEEPTPSLTPMTPVETQATPMLMCTPPACSAGEVFHCPDECPGGCGTVCATPTPEPDAETPTTESDVETPSTETAPPSGESVTEFPDPSQYAWVPVADGLDQPLGLFTAGDGSGRAFVLEQPGLIWVFQNWERLPTPFLDIRDRVVDDRNEQGLLGLAFHPDFGSNGLFYINYTGENGDTFISRFNVSADPNIANPASENVLLRIQQPFANHNGGHILFAPDGYLYIGTGDGGSAGDPQGNAQNPNSLLGKLLRIDVDAEEPYGIPNDNPYASGGGRAEVWAIGLRNPWRYSFDRETNDLYIGDVGQNQWEEINYLAAGHTGGVNFGWDYFEASNPFEGNPPQGFEAAAPIWEYNHSQGCSVTGGYVYRGSLAEWQGIYIYGDYCSGLIWGLLRDAQGFWQNMLIIQTTANITSFGEDQNGEVYMIDRSGSVNRLEKIP
jgi:glucose/arabinose dehydrogenase